ncbi:hypothetical protein NW762_010628 [Fusarium torreyae]|uniref:Uncharacterized protein n=1 Tax=Fusarium torreyae TaxID=1237075 RepID=A0A9W8RTB3_9HYPO|nr:hypothetical protein NW762_010628 [Fusarium torreyae]
MSMAMRSTPSKFNVPETPPTPWSCKYSQQDTEPRGIWVGFTKTIEVPSNGACFDDHDDPHYQCDEDWHDPRDETPCPSPTARIFSPLVEATPTTGETTAQTNVIDDLDVRPQKLCDLIRLARL